MVARLAAAAPDTAEVTAQITATPAGAKIEVLLKDKEKLRGGRGAISASGFALVDAHKGERQILFDDVVSVKPAPNSHVLRNVLIGVGIGIVVTIVALVAYAKSQC
jgi:hypothetical protein